MNGNLFDKVDRQGEAIDQIATKLDGVSIEDLYALAKRTWDYKDFEMAQKYYNHISLLNPLDWKAPFCASLCGELTPASYGEWEERPFCVCRCYSATIKYIENRSISSDEKVVQMTEATDIVMEVFYQYERCYLHVENRKGFDEYAPKLTGEIQKGYISIIKILEAVEFAPFVELIAKVGSACKSFIENCCTGKAVVISKEDYEKYLSSDTNGIKFDECCEEKLDAEQKKEIMLKGVCYWKPADEILFKRLQKRTLVFGVMLALLSLISGYYSYIHSIRWMIVMNACVMLEAVVLLLRVFCRRKGIRQDSFLNFRRERNRLDSNGSIVSEGVFSPVSLFEAILLYISIYAYIFNTIFFAKKEGAVLPIACGVVIVLILWVQWYMCSENSMGYSRVKKYYYKRKMYRID